ncbi:MAG: hypothetical protein MZV65_53375 [Chromatiales bacterium]|nr:hypothetical protein [Chromatiales bacterium]
MTRTSCPPFSIPRELNAQLRFGSCDRLVALAAYTRYRPGRQPVLLLGDTAYPAGEFDRGVDVNIGGRQAAIDAVEGAQDLVALQNWLTSLTDTSYLPIARDRDGS